MDDDVDHDDNVDDDVNNDDVDDDDQDDDDVDVVVDDAGIVVIHSNRTNCIASASDKSFKFLTYQLPKVR